ncbi:crAss001_48 related protein [Microbulbifer sp. 2201CG32-9]|uniref:crAss001_48 related protein n=1 Tax=Microbulbifer sp. 2201CG32-9 TaxID=3232309 RepID=UPI00345C1E44
MSDFIGRLHKEIVGLTNKRLRLNGFLESKDYSDLESEEKELLQEQRKVMSRYHRILIQRLERHESH